MVNIGKNIKSLHKMKKLYKAGSNILDISNKMIVWNVKIEVDKNLFVMYDDGGLFYF